MEDKFKRKGSSPPTLMPNNSTLVIKGDQEEWTMATNKKGENTKNVLKVHFESPSMKLLEKIYYESGS